MNRITKNELAAINARLAAEVEALRAELSAAKVTQQAKPTLKEQFIGSAKATFADLRAEAEHRLARTKSFIKRERNIATFFDLKSAGEYITQLKQRGLKLNIFARRNARNSFDIIVVG